MCYSFKASIVSFLLGMMAGVFAVYTGQYALGFLILAYVQVQLAEAIIWRGIDTENIKLNRIGTFYAKYTLPAHLLAVGLGYLVGLYIDKKNVRPIHFLPLLAGIAVYLYVVLVVYRNCTVYTTYPLEMCKDRKCQNDRNRLQYKWPLNWYLWMTFLICVIILCITPLYSGLLLVSTFLLLLLLTRRLYPKRYGSVWCFASAVVAPILVVLNYYLTRQ